MSEVSEPSLLSRTGAAVRVVPRRRDAGFVFVATTLGYLVVYLASVGDLSLGGGGGVSVTLASDLGRALSTTGYFRYEAIALVSAGPVTFLFSPVNSAIAIVLSTLVGVNLALSYLGWVQPRACGLEASSGAIAGVPALLSGAACCGPTILVVVGIQASGALITVFEFLIPVAIALLVGSLLLIGRQVDPALL